MKSLSVEFVVDECELVADECEPPEGALGSSESVESWSELSVELPLVSIAEAGGVLGDSVEWLWRTVFINPRSMDPVQKGLLREGWLLSLFELELGLVGLESRRSGTNARAEHNQSEYHRSEQTNNKQQTTRRKKLN